MDKNLSLLENLANFVKFCKFFLNFAFKSYNKHLLVKFFLNFL